MKNVTESQAEVIYAIAEAIQKRAAANYGDADKAGLKKDPFYNFADAIQNILLEEPVT